MIVGQPNPREKQCTECGKTFLAPRPNSKGCSDKCKAVRSLRLKKSKADKKVKVVKQKAVTVTILEKSR